MSWLRKPGSRVLHIIDWQAPGLAAHCPARFPDPHLTNYWVGDRAQGEWVCAHCARRARWMALHLLAQADGMAITDPTVRRRSAP